MEVPVGNSRKFGRADLVGKLMRECGLSRRESVLVVNTILDRMVHHLRLGHAVEFPYGKLRRVKRHFGDYWDALDDWPADQHPYKVVYESE